MPAHPPRHHRLAGAGRADEQEIVAAGRTRLRARGARAVGRARRRDRATSARWACGGGRSRRRRAGARTGRSAREPRRRATTPRRTSSPDDDRRLARVGRRQQDAGQAFAPRRRGDRQHAARRHESIRRATARRAARDRRSAAARRRPDAARMPSAIGRSNDAPALRTSAGARLTVMRCGGNSKPELRMALPDAVAALADAGVGQADHRERRESRTRRRPRRGPGRPRRRTPRPSAGSRASSADGASAVPASGPTSRFQRLSGIAAAAPHRRFCQRDRRAPVRWARTEPSRRRYGCCTIL